jgi:hypothetical protein
MEAERKPEKTRMRESNLRKHVNERGEGRKESEKERRRQEQMTESRW